MGKGGRKGGDVEVLRGWRLVVVVWKKGVGSGSRCRWCFNPSQWVETCGRPVNHSSVHSFVDFIHLEQVVVL